MISKKEMKERKHIIYVAHVIPLPVSVAMDLFPVIAMDLFPVIP